MVTSSENYHEFQVISAVKIQFKTFLRSMIFLELAGIDTRALTKILREKGTMNGMITTNESYNLDEIIPKLKEYTTGKVVERVTCEENMF